MARTESKIVAKAVRFYKAFKGSADYPTSIRDAANLHQIAPSTLMRALARAKKEAK